MLQRFLEVTLLARVSAVFSGCGESASQRAGGTAGGAEAGATTGPSGGGTASSAGRFARDGAGAVAGASTQSRDNWMSALNCAPGAFIIEAGPPGANGWKSVGDGGGYGGIYYLH